ncbi:MAG TPA: response regulator, partial [Dehalococcoidia bacterium]|nr:response regulator [Dehalococcoidia bacterium]
MTAKFAPISKPERTRSGLAFSSSFTSEDITFAIEDIKRVLVVDDSQLSRHFLLGKLSDFYDCELEEAEDGQEALDILLPGNGSDASPGLILLDLNLPKISGR